MPIINLPSRNVQLNFPDSMSDQEIQSAIDKEYPRSGEDVAFDVDQIKNAALEGQSSINPFDAMSNDDYILYRKHLADKKTSLGDALGIAKDTFGHIIDEVGTGIGATAYTLGQGEVGKAAESAGAGMVAGTVGLTDLASKILKPAKAIPTKEEFIGKPITRLVDQPQKEGVTGLTYAWPSEEQDVTTEEDYKKLIESEKQRDADSVNNIYAMELTMRGAPVEEISRGFQYVDPTILAGAASAALKTGASLFSKAGAKAALRAAGSAAVESTAPSALNRAGLSAVEGVAKGVETAAAIPSNIIQGVGRVAESVMPGTGVGAKAAALTGATMADAGLTAGVIGGAKAAEKTAEVVGAAARIAKQEASRASLLERAALDETLSPPARKLAGGLAQLQPVGRVIVDLSKGAIKGALTGSVVGGVIGGLAERNLESAAAGAGAGTAFGGMFGALHSAFDLGKEAIGGSTSRTRQQAAGDINTFVSTRPQVEQSAWSDLMNKLVYKLGPEQAASQLDAMRVAEASGSTLRVATPDEIKQWNAPGWADIDKDLGRREIVFNPERIQGDTAAHEAAHMVFSSAINKAFRPEIETAIYGIADPITGQIVKPGVFDDIALARIADQIKKSYEKSNNTLAANKFEGYVNKLKNSTDLQSLNEARSSIADELTAIYTGRLFERTRAGRFNPDRLPLVYRKVLASIEDGVLDKFRSVLYEKGMDLGFDEPSKTFRNEKGKAIRIPALDSIIRKAFEQKLNAKDAANAKPDLIPVKPADRVLWAKSYGGARGILNDDGTPKSQAQIDAEAAARWQDMTMRLSALPDSEKIGIDFSRDKSGKTVMTAKGQLSPSAINAILDSGALDQSARSVLVEILNSMQRADKSTFDTRYYGVYTRGKGGNKMVAGVKSASQNEILPYSVEINSKDGVLIRAVDMSKVRDRLVTAMRKPEFKSVYTNPAEALKDLRKYMDNLTQINAIDSATLLGGGTKGAAKRNLFYDALGFRLRNGETLLNAPQRVINKSQNTIKSYRAERFAKLVDSGNKFAFEEATTYGRVMKNFQPDAFTPEALPNGEAFTNPDGFRILNKTGSKLFRTYDDTGKLIGVAESKEKAVKKAMDEATKRMTKEEVKTKEPESSKRFQPSDGVPIVGKEGDSETIPLYQKKENGKLLFERDGTPKVVNYNYDLLNLDNLKRFKGPVEDKTLVSESQFDYDVGPKAIKAINDAIKSGAVDSLVNKTVRETLAMMEDPSIVAGKGWYSRMRVSLKKVYGDFSETFAQLLGATSAQTPVDQNFLQAVEAAEMIKSGAYDNNRKQYLVMRQSMADGTIKQVIKDRGLVPKINIQIQKLQEILPQLTKKAEKESLAADIKSLSKLIDTPEDKWTNANMSDIFMLGEDIIPRRNNGRKYNANSKQVLAVIGGDWLRVVDAPKTPNFAGNLTGRTLQATIDVWAARFMRRMIYGGTDAPWRIQYDAEVGVTNRDFAFSQIVLERAAKKLNMNPDDLQAVLWFGEKDIYSKKNWTSAEGKKKASFDEMFNLFFPANGKPRTFSEVRDMLDKQKK